MWETESAKQDRCRTLQEKIREKKFFKKLRVEEIKCRDFKLRWCRARDLF